METETYKKILEEKKASLEKELASFAVKDPQMKDNWEAKVRKAEDTDMEERADEAQEYDNLLSVEYSLELKLKDVASALEKVAKGTYGICEKCGKHIEDDRLQAVPEARLCVSCNNEK